MTCPHRRQRRGQVFLADAQGPDDYRVMDECLDCGANVRWVPRTECVLPNQLEIIRDYRPKKKRRHAG